jgi:hypothetical protein
MPYKASEPNNQTRKVVMAVMADDNIQVFVAPLEGKTLVILLPRTANTDVLFHEVSEKTGIPEEHMRLSYRSKSLEKGKTLQYFEIKNMSTIHLLLRLVGGGGANTASRPSGSADQIPREVVCILCARKLDPSNMGLSCDNGHTICKTGECNESFLNKALLSEIATIFPPCCSVCHIRYPTDPVYDMLEKLPFEKRLEVAKDIFYYHTIDKTLHVDEVKVCCPNPACEYMEIHPKGPGFRSIECKKCKLQSCIYCGSSAKGDHSICEEYGHIKLELNTAVKEGSYRRCPKCRNGGVKDDKCVHITCKSCGEEYCYICLKTKSEIAEPWYEHMSDFDKNRNHCPMHLNKIPTYPSNEDAAVRFFHENLKCHYLKPILDKYGEAGQGAFQLFGDDYGITLTQALNPVPFIAQVKRVY